MDHHTDRNKRRISDGSSTITKRRKHAEPESPLKGLAHLPEEVLLLVLDVVLGRLIRCGTLGDALQHVKTLHTLCLTSSKLNRLATPYLCAFLNNRNRRKVPQALDAMILDAKKAEGIKYMSWALDVKRSSQAMYRRSPKAETIYLQKLGRLGIPELAGDLRQCFHGNSPEYHLATALVLAPNLEYLEAADVNYEQDTPDDVVWRPTWLELLSLKALSSPPGLSQHFQLLRHLCLDMGELSFEQIGPLLRLPALRILHLVRGQRSGRIRTDPWNEEVGDGRSPIQVLLFEDCLVSSKVVARVMAAIQQLKVLKLDLSDWTSADLNGEEPLGSQQLSWSILNRAIVEHKESLERLYLVEGDIGSWGDEGDEVDIAAILQHRLACLRDMHKLRYLDTGLKYIQTSLSRIGPNSPLPSLEHLVIQVEEDSGYPIDYFPRALQDLATHCRSRLPVLKDVMVWLPRSYYDPSRLLELDFSACEAALGGQGIDVVIMIYLHEQKKWQLHPSTVAGSSIMAGSSCFCELHNANYDPLEEEGRTRVVFHGICNAYHHPSGWSIIDDYKTQRS